MLWTGALRIKARDIESVRARARAHIASRPQPRVLFDERRGTQRSEFNRSTLFWCCIAKTVRNMSQIMRLRKVCPQCGTTVHVKRSRCACGHAFALKMKALLTADNQRELAKRRRAMEFVEETFQRQEQDRTHRASMTASETQEQTLERREQNKMCMASMRASEMQQQTLERQEQNKIRMASMRAFDTQEQTLERQEQNKIRMVSMRASETQEQTLERQEQSKIRMASMRASETSNKMKCRKQSNMESMANRRSKNVNVKDAISLFQSDVKLGPDFVCTCCHRMMYRKSVILCNKVKYTNTSTDVLQKVFCPKFSFVSHGGKEWICKTCDRTLSRGSMPLQAKGNGLQLCEVPPELSGLNPLELR